MDTAEQILRESKVIAVVGLSDRPDRPSHGVARYMQEHGYRIIPVNPKLTGPVLGEQPYARLEDVPEHVDVVTYSGERWMCRPLWTGPSA